MIGRERYAEKVSAVGQAGLELARAEASMLAGDLRLSTKALARVVVLVLLAAALGFWALAVLVFLGIEVGSLWMPRWLATLAVLGILLVAALVVALVARWTLRRVQSPAAIIRRRFDDHREWWHRRLERSMPRGGAGRGSRRGEDPRGD